MYECVSAAATPPKWERLGEEEVYECVCVCVSEDMSSYCSVYDEWLIMKLCMYVDYHDANNVSNLTQVNFINV